MSVKHSRLVQWVGLVLIATGVFLVGCTPAPPSDVGNICKIFKEYPNWYWDARKTQKKWGVPVNVQLAIIHQESKFDAKARPDRTKLLWVIPWKRPSSAYGYSQALKQTWEHYQASTGKKGSRDSFAAASDFIGWYADQAHRKAGISKYNAYELYLAYHEGIGGYQRETYLKKTWLMNVAKKVQANAALYQQQLATCEHKIKKPWWKLF